MDSERKPRSGMISLIAALVVVCALWLVAPHTEWYRDYKTRSEIKGVLQAIQPPDGATLRFLRTTHHAGDIWFGVCAYDTDLSIETLSAHYMQEFSRDGFVYKRDDKSRDSQTSLEFCRAGYAASLIFIKADVHPYTYMIVLKRNHATC